MVNEDYRWWWRSFLHAGSCAFYTALYAVWYHLTELEMTGLVPVLLYYGYMSIICFTFFLVTGKISSYYYVLYIYMYCIVALLYRCCCVTVALTTCCCIIALQALWATSPAFGSTCRSTAPSRWTKHR